MLAKTNQALGTLETYRQRLEQVLTRLTALEFQNAVVLDDVLVVLQRAEMTSRMAERIERDCVELGSEGRLIRLQLEELVGDVPAERDAIVRDYHAARRRRRGDGRRSRACARSATRTCSSSSASPSCSATTAASTRSTTRSSPRGYRVLSHIPRLPEPSIRRVVERLRHASTRSSAPRSAISRRVEGVGAVRAREIREGLRRLQEHNLVDRYLQL